MSEQHTPIVGTYGHGSITLTAYPSSGRIKVEATAENSVMDWSDLFEFVDRVRKPRTITTAEELDALPVGSVVLRHGRAFQRFAPRAAAFGEYKKWQCTDGGFVRSTKDGSTILPATLIHEATL
jgi:hypothetical protein